MTIDTQTPTVTLPEMICVCKDADEAEADARLEGIAKRLRLDRAELYERLTLRLTGLYRGLLIIECDQWFRVTWEGGRDDKGTTHYLDCDRSIDGVAAIHELVFPA